jgi:hypothetical protein
VQHLGPLLRKEHEDRLTCIKWELDDIVEEVLKEVEEEVVEEEKKEEEEEVLKPEEPEEQEDSKDNVFIFK